LNHQEINAKIQRLEQKKLSLASHIQSLKTSIGILKTDIDTIQNTATATGQKFRQLTKELNKKKATLSSTKRQIMVDESELNSIPAKIKRYEYVKKKTPTDVYDWINQNVEEVNKNSKNPRM
jgi:chromosome segregation ATPase